MSMRNGIVSTGLLILLGSTGNAQTPDRVQQAESLQRRQQAEQLEAAWTEETAPELFLGEFEDVGPQSIVRVKQRRTYFEAAIDSQFFFTSNMFLEEDGDGADPTESTVFVNRVHLALAPLAYVVGPGQLQPSLGFRHTWFNYGLGEHHSQLNGFDFDSQTVFTDMRYRLKGGWTFGVGFDWTRLLDHNPDYFDYNRFYSEYVPRWSVTRQLALSESRFFTLGYEGAYRFTDTEQAFTASANDRTDHVLSVTYTHAFTPRLVVQPYYRAQYTRYTDSGDRDDFTHTTGLSVYYALARWLSVRAFGSYERRDSDDRLVADYQKYDAGLGLSLVGRF